MRENQKRWEEAEARQREEEELQKERRRQEAMARAVKAAPLIAVGTSHTVCLRADSTVVAVGDNRRGQCDVGGWKLFNSIDTLEQERIATLSKERLSLQTELANLKGLFSWGTRRELEARLANIEVQLAVRLCGTSRLT